MRCEVCGTTKDIAGVAASGLGAWSFCFCRVCLAMGAEPRFMVEGTVECCGGLDNVRKDICLTYYDYVTDTYVDVREGPVAIVMKNAPFSFLRREDYLRYVEESKSIESKL